MQDTYTVRIIGTFRGMNGNGFNSVLYRGSVRLGMVNDGATGDPLIFDISEEDKAALNTYAASLPAYMRCCERQNTDSTKSTDSTKAAEWLVRRLVDKMVLLKKVRAILQNGNVLVATDNKSVYGVQYAKSVSVKIMVDHKKNHPTACVLNRFSNEGLLTAFDEYDVDTSSKIRIQPA